MTTSCEMSSPDAAELAKLLENVFRYVNIAFVNQLALLCERMGLDVWEVIDAAATKPFGFMRFTPGPGVGGHCIPVDSYYLSWRAREFGFVDRFIEAASDINGACPATSSTSSPRPSTTAARPSRAPGSASSAWPSSPTSATPATRPPQEVMAGLTERGAEVRYHDPHVAALPRCRRRRATVVDLDRLHRLGRCGRGRDTAPGDRLGPGLRAG